MLGPSAAAIQATLGRPGELPVRIDNEFASDAGVEALVAFRRLLQIDHLDIDDLGDGQPVPKDRLHELPVVFQHRRLAGMEAVRLCPTETKPQAKVAIFGCLLLCARLGGHIQTGNADRAGRPGDVLSFCRSSSRRPRLAANALLPLIRPPLNDFSSPAVVIPILRQFSVPLHLGHVGFLQRAQAHAIRLRRP
jgi:hypothetical protein